MPIKTEIALSNKKWTAKSFHSGENNNVTINMASNLVGRIRSNNLNLNLNYHTGRNTALTYTSISINVP